VRPLFTSRNREAAALAARLARVAGSSLPVLVEGESGTGKSFVATALHRRGRRGRPFVVVDCAAVPESLLAAELFGHRAGAFTDALRARQGWLARAGDGTLVLERVDTLPATGQVALLRVLEERTFFPVGTETPVRFAARVVATVASGATSDLDAGPLRGDLYHRLAGLHVTLPPLRRRREDIVPFSRATVRAQARRLGRDLALTADAEALLAAYPWPGNFRELAAALERACLKTDGPAIAAGDLDLGTAGWPEMAALAAERELPADQATRLYGLLVLSRHGGNVSAAARSLGVSRRTLIRWRDER